MDAFLLESIFRNEVWGFMQEPVRAWGGGRPGAGVGVGRGPGRDGTGARLGGAARDAATVPPGPWQTAFPRAHGLADRGALLPAATCRVLRECMTAAALTLVRRCRRAMRRRCAPCWRKARGRPWPATPPPWTR